MGSVCHRAGQQRRMSHTAIDNTFPVYDTPSSYGTLAVEALHVQSSRKFDNHIRTLSRACRRLRVMNVSCADSSIEFEVFGFPSEAIVDATTLHSPLSGKLLIACGDDCGMSWECDDPGSLEVFFVSCLDLKCFNIDLVVLYSRERLYESFRNMLLSSILPVNLRDPRALTA